MRLLKLLVIAFILFAGFFALNHIQNNSQKQAYISITFDDGFVSQYKAAETLESYGWKGVFYFPSELAGKEFENIPVMDWNQITDLYSRGHEIGGHTATHARASNSNEAEWESEVKNGELLLEQHSINANSFAYPYNDLQYLDVPKKYFSSCRNVNGGINDIGAIEISGTAITNENYKDLPNLLQKLKSDGGWLVLVIHNIDENPRPNIDLTEENLLWVLEQIRQSEIPVKTIGKLNG